jgi:hypothetical protein
MSIFGILMVDCGSWELVTDTIESGLPQVKPKAGLGLQELGTPTARGKAPGGPINPDLPT